MILNYEVRSFIIRNSLFLVRYSVPCSVFSFLKSLLLFIDKEHGIKRIVITIDGWSSCGKSTLAKQLAKKLGYLYVDSGAMYRAITLLFFT